MRLGSRITAVDVHACGEPGRVVIDGVYDVPGRTMFEKKAHLEQHDRLRQLMLREPRGYPALCANVILPPTLPDADAGFVIMEQTEYPPMSGSNTICVVTTLIETGMVPVVEPVTTLRLDTPAGLIEVVVEVRHGRAEKVTFENVPAFATHLDAELDVPHLGTLRVDVAYGGMFFVIAEAADLGVELEPDHAAEICRAGAMIRQAAREQLPVVHPDNPHIDGVTISQVSGPARDPGNHCRNTVVVATGGLDWDRPATWTGAVDRSPCGTGTCARMAVLHARGELPLDRAFRHEGILDTVFEGRLLRETRVGPYDAVVPTISGRGWITGYADYVVAGDDPFPAGFTVGDIWA